MCCGGKDVEWTFSVLQSPPAFPPPPVLEYVTSVTKNLRIFLTSSFLAAPTCYKDDKTFSSLQGTFCLSRRQLQTYSSGYSWAKTSTLLYNFFLIHLQCQRSLPQTRMTQQYYHLYLESLLRGATQSTGQDSSSWEDGPDKCISNSTMMSQPL